MITWRFACALPLLVNFLYCGEFLTSHALITPEREVNAMSCVRMASRSEHGEACVFIERSIAIYLTILTDSDPSLHETQGT